jgi:hypothetical protein
MRRKVGFLTAVVGVGVRGLCSGGGERIFVRAVGGGKAVVFGGSAGTCGSAATKVVLPASAAEQQTLLSILPHISFLSGGEPTIRFSGVNVQVVNGTGSTFTANGRGNLIIGYNEHSAIETQTGSHNLVLGAHQSFTSFGGLIGGANNKVTGPSSVVFGAENTASGDVSAVTGGAFNTAGSFSAAVSGGDHNTASGERSAVSGGRENIARGFAATVFGCRNVTVSKNDASNPNLCP